MFHVPWMFEMSVDGCGAIKEGQRRPQLTALHLFLELSIKNGLQIGNWTELTPLHKTLLVSTPPHFVAENSLCAPISLPTVSTVKSFRRCRYSKCLGEDRDEQRKFVQNKSKYVQPTNSAGFLSDGFL